MTSEEVAGFLGMVEAVLGRQYQPMSRPLLSKTLEKEPVDASIAAYKYMENHPDWKPNPNELIKLVRDQGAKIRERESKDRKSTLPGEAPQQNTDMDQVKKAGLLLQAFTERKITRATFLEGFRKLDDLYPKAGWAIQGGILARWYAKDTKGLPLTGHSHKFISVA